MTIKLQKLIFIMKSVEGADTLMKVVKTFIAKQDALATLVRAHVDTFNKYIANQDKRGMMTGGSASTVSVASDDSLTAEAKKKQNKIIKRLVQDVFHQNPFMDSKSIKSWILEDMSNRYPRQALVNSPLELAGIIQTCVLAVIISRPFCIMMYHCILLLPQGTVKVPSDCRV